MRILLIYPYPLYDRSQAHEEDISVVPIGLYYIGAVLREEGYDVEILNWYRIHKTPQRIVDTLVEKKPDIIGFSILNANRWGGIEIAQIAKELNPKVKIVFGGVAATFLWKHFLTHFPQVDFVVIGEGEYPFLHLVKAVDRGRHKHLKDIPGIAFRRGGKVIKTKAAKPVGNLDKLPIPAKHFAYQHVVSSRGCPGKCTFCGSPKLWGNRTRLRSAEHFVRELELLYNRGIRFFYFSDDTFTINEKRVIEICKRIIEKGLKIVWVAISRADLVSDAILYWMRKAGCTQISYGVESGSDKIRGLLNKRLKRDDIKAAFSLTYRYGILARAYFIYGSPEESWETIEETIDLIKEIRPFVCVFYILEIYPGTMLYSDLQKRRHVTDDVWLEKIEGICYFESDADLSQERVLAFGKRLRTEFFANLSRFVDSLDLIDEEEFHEMHADFCSRLGMTLSHGDYAQNEFVVGREGAAEALFKKALTYAPDHRAYLGLGVIEQNRHAYEDAGKILAEGVTHFPDSEELNLCLGINYMNLRGYDKALECLLKCQDSEETSYHIASCYGALGDHQKEEAFLEKGRRLAKSAR
ncbi:MAG: radical SAM protein [Thermodesulfobacteriota bacterium]|nr:radical SAM protein [Thermodesulfobacteriota bacterium]